MLVVRTAPVPIHFAIHSSLALGKYALTYYCNNDTTILSGVSFSDITFGMCWCLMSWVQQVHNAAVVARSLGCQCDTEMPTGRTLTET